MPVLPPVLAMSSYSLREQLGPIDISFTDDAGQEHRFQQDHEQLLTISQFPARARAAFGVDTLETVAFQFAGLDDPQIDAFAAALTAEGMTLLNIAVDSGDLLRADPERRAADIAELTRWIDRFAAVGVRFVRVNPGSPFSPDHGDVPPQHLVDALRGLGQHARAAGVRLLVENHGGPSSNPVWMNALLQACEGDVGLLLDLGNFDALLAPLMQQLTNPDAAPVDLATVDLTSLYAELEQLAPRAELVHVKAHNVGADGGVGPVDLDRALAILTKHGYDGPLTIEYEGVGGDPWENSRQVFELTSELSGVPTR